MCIIIILFKCLYSLYVIHIINPLSCRYLFYRIYKTAFENIVENKETAREISSRAVSSFPTMFSTQSENCISICQYL